MKKAASVTRCRRIIILNYTSAAYIEAAGIGSEKDTPLFRTAKGKTKRLTDHRLSQPEVYLMIRRRAGRGRNADSHRLPYVSSDGHHGLFEKRRETGNSATDGRA